ncbi:MAG: hypothetical protein LBD53_08560 [Tannerella sp.]|jgi:hypothetical protein|nr:hypothetical protein [Tannerella sp.]
MDKVYRKKQTQRLVLWGILLFGIVEIAFICFVMPQYYTHLLLVIPVYFMLMGYILLYILARFGKQKIHPSKALARLMLFNVVQMMISFAMVFVYFYTAINHKHTILIAFSVYYIFFMGLKLYIFYSIDNQHKKNKKQLT